MKYFEDVLSVIKEAIYSINEVEFNKMVDHCTTALKAGHKIIVTGLGKNVPICEKFVGTMLSMGLEANFLHTNSAIHGDIGMVKSGDVVILLSASGKTKETVYLHEQLEKRDCIQWLITYNRNSILAEQMKNALIMKLSKEGDMWNIIPNNSTSINLILLQALAMIIAEKLNVTLEDFKRNHPGGAIGEKLNGK